MSFGRWLRGATRIRFDDRLSRVLLLGALLPVSAVSRSTNTALSPHLTLGRYEEVGVFGRKWVPVDTLRLPDVGRMIRPTGSLPSALVPSSVGPLGPLVVAHETPPARSTTLARQHIDAEVVAGQRVAIAAHHLPRVPRCWPIPTQDILAVCRGCQVGGVEARPISAQVVQCQAVWNWPDEDLVCRPVREITAPAYLGQGAGSHIGVAVCLELTRPNPAPMIATLGVPLDLFAQPIVVNAHSQNITPGVQS